MLAVPLGLMLTSAVLLSAVASSSSRGEPALTQSVQAELKSATQQLGELIRRDVETIKVDGHSITVPLQKAVPNGGHQTTGVLVPFLAEGQGGGNFSAWYVALFTLMTPDERLLADFGHRQNLHEHVALVAFSQLDNRRRQIPHWEQAVVDIGVIMVPVETLGCTGHNDSITIRVNQVMTGPNIIIVYEAGSTLDPHGCPVTR